MERRDYLVDELNRAGRVLAAILSRILQQPTQGLTLADAAAQTLKDELDWDLPASLDLPEEAFLPHLLQDKNLDDQQLGMLTELLERLGDALPASDLRDQRRRYHARALQICMHLDQYSRLYSFDRAARMDRLKASLGLE